jgi:hypothetical protein
MTREEALDRLSRPAYAESEVANDFEFIADKLEIGVNELRELMNGENRSYRDYKSIYKVIDLGTKILTSLGFQKAIIR